MDRRYRGRHRGTDCDGYHGLRTVKFLLVPKLLHLGTHCPRNSMAAFPTQDDGVLFFTCHSA